MKFCLLFLLLPFCSFAQEWQLQTPIKDADDIRAIEMSDKENVYMLSSSGIMISRDGGASWNRKGGGSFTIDGDLHMFDENNGIIAMNLNLFSTNNACEGLQFIQSASFKIKKLHFVDALIGFAVGDDGNIIKTIDGGASWNAQNSNTTADLWSVFFVDANLGFACGSNSTFLKTEDGGLTWLHFLVGSTARWEDVYFANAQNGLLVGRYNSLKYTTDGGTTWIDSDYQTPDDLYTIEAVNNQLIVGGEDGLVLNSIDGGVKWTESHYGNDDFFAIDFYNNKGIIGGDAILYESLNFGNDWTLNQKDFRRSDLNSVHFADELHGVAVGDGSTLGFGIILGTNDGGANWETITLSSGDFYGVHLLQDGNGILSSAGGKYSLTTDFGQSWNSRPSAGNIAALSCWMHNTEEYLVAGGNGIPQFTGILHTDDNGANWKYTATYIIEDMYFPTKDIGYAVGGGWTIHKTIDGGETWSDIATTTGSNYESVYFLTEDLGYLGGPSGVSKTTDGGLTWESFGAAGPSIEVYFYTEMIGYTVAPTGYVQKTKDGGQTWEQVIREYPNQTLTDAHFFEDRIIAVGKNSDIFSASVFPVVMASPAADLILCDDNNSGDEKERFDLTATENQIINGQMGLTITFHLNQAAANSGDNPIPNPTQYENTTNTQTIYARAKETSSGDYATTSFELIVNALPASQEPGVFEVCDESQDGFGVFKLADKDAEIINGEANIFVHYYETQAAAMLGQSSEQLENLYTNTNAFNQTIYARAQNSISGCYKIIPLELLVNLLPDGSAAVAPFDTCEVPFDGISSFDLSIKNEEILNGQDPGIFQPSFYLSSSDATINVNPILTPNAFENTTNPQSIYARILNMNSGCYAMEVQSFDISVQLNAAINEVPDDIAITEGPNDGLAIFDLTINEAQVLGMQDPSLFTFNYYETLSDAEADVDPIEEVRMYQNIQNPQTIYLRISHSTNGCYALTQFMIEADALSGQGTFIVNDFRLFPNPTSRLLSLYSDQLDLVTRVEVFNVHGQLLATETKGNNATSIDIDLLNNRVGVYLVKVNFENSSVFLKAVKL